jgi:hypothetical protein
MESGLPNNERVLFRVVLCVLISCLIASFSAVNPQAEEPPSQEPLLRLLPLESDLKGWKLDGEPQTAEGMGLFELINGGAEEYVKEGFRRAVIATYINSEGKRINLDIYEMLSPESTRSIYRKKAGDKGTKVPIGEEAALEDYYLNFRKGAYQVTLSGYDTQKETLEWLLQIGRLVAERISIPAGTP